MTQRFHSIDTLRFLAFLKVFLLHIPVQGEGMELFKLLKRGGGIGVLFFFVLSGFLITHILIKEKSRTHQINIIRFCRNRVLRIFPLFYVAVLFAFCFPEPYATQIGLRMVGGGYEPQIWSSFTFLENYQMLLQDNFPRNTPLSVFWSLCIEEHFYLLWVLLAAFLPLRFFPKIMIASFLFAPIIRLLYAHFSNNTMIEDCDLFTNLDLFAGGSLLGYLIATQHEKISKKINQVPSFFKYLLMLIVVCVVVFEKDFVSFFGLNHILMPTIFALLFTMLIAIFIPINSAIKINDNNILARWGQWSYGLYIFHIIVIHVFFQYCIKHNILLDNYLSVGIFTIIAFVSSLFLSYCSYNYFEKLFLKFKK